MTTIVLICQHSATACDAFSYPLQSSRLGMHKVSHRMTDPVPLPLYSVATYRELCSFPIAALTAAGF